MLPRLSLSRFRRRLRGPLALLLALLILGIASGTAVADHGGREIGSFMACDRPVTPPRCTSVGDGPLHLVALDGSLRDDLARALRASMAEDYDEPTRLRVIAQPRVTPLTDVIAFSGDYGDNGAAGWVYCPSDAPQGINRFDHRWCRHQELHLNVNARYALFFDDEASRGHIACHELGHTLGLRHWGNPPETDGPVGATCMNANTPNGPTSLHQTDIDHLNRYGFPVIPTPTGVRVARAPGPPPPFFGMSAGRVHALETEDATSLRALIHASDAIVHGRITGVEPGRVFGPAGRPLHYAAVTVEVVARLAGALPSGSSTVTLEIPLFDGPDAIDGLRAATVGTERVLFLRDKAASAAAAGMSSQAQAADAGYYRLTTLASEIVEVDRLAVAPEDERGLLAPLATGSFTDAIELVRAAADEQASGAVRSNP